MDNQSSQREPPPEPKKKRGKTSRNQYVSQGAGDGVYHDALFFKKGHRG